MLQPNTILSAIGIVFFCAASVCAVVDLLRTHPPEKGEQGVSLFLAFGCVSLLATLVLQGINTHSIVPLFNRFDTLTVYVVFLTIAALCLLRQHRTQGLMAILAPYATILLIAGFPAVNVRTELVPPQVVNTALFFHLVTVFAGYALFSLASILACAYLVQDHNLKYRHFGIVFEKFPALETLDHLMFRMIGTSFLLITISLALGYYLVHETGRMSEWITDPKVMATMATWTLCAVLVHMRANIGRHGTRLALFTVAGLALILFSMVGVHLVAQSIHNFVQIGSTLK